MPDPDDADPAEAVQPLTEEEVQKNRKQARIELIVMLAILFFIFVVFLPQFIDYGQVIDSMFQLTWPQIVVLAILGLVRTWFEAGVYNVLIPGLRWWDGWKAWASSNSVAFIAPPGVDLAIRYGMYRSVGIKGDAATGGIILSWFFTTGIKLIIPIFTLVLIVLGGIDDDLVVTVTLIGSGALVGGILFIFLILYRETIAFRVGATMEKWYNSLLAGRWKFEPLSGFGDHLVAFRSEIIGTLRTRWFPATAVTLTSQVLFFFMLLLSLRFMGVTAEQAPWDVIFDAYAIGLLLSLIPIFPAGLGVVEVVYVGIIAGESGTDLANAVMAGAFVHRIFTWLLPILVGLIPLSTWRKQMRRAEKAGTPAAGSPASHDDNPSDQ